MDVSEEEITKTVITLDKIYKQLEDKAFYLNLSGDALSYTATKIAVMKARMVDVKKMAEINAKDADTNYKAVKAHTLRRLIGSPLNGDEGPKISATAAGELLYGEEEVIGAAKDRNQKEAVFNRLKSMVADGHDVIESIRGRLIDLNGGRKDERIS